MKTSSLALALTGLVVIAMRVDALPSYVPRIPNGANVPNVPAVGHSDKTGDSGDLDAFGVAFEKAGDKWTVELCKADSDGDGQTNGEELGDPCCEWTVGGKPKFTTGVSNPGDAASKVSASVLSSNSCGGGAAATKTSAPTADKTDSGSGAATVAPANADDASASAASNSTKATDKSEKAPTPMPSVTSGANHLLSAAASTSLAACLVLMAH